MRKLLNVVIVLAATAAAAFILAGLGVLLTAGPGALRAGIFRAQLQPVRAGASVPQAVEALQQAFPGDDVRVEAGEVVVTITRNPFDALRARRTLESQGFQGTSFSTSRGFAPSKAVAESFRAMLLLTGPLALLASGALLRPRLPAARRAQLKSGRAIAMAGVGGGLVMIAIVHVAGIVAAALGYPIVEQPWIETLVRAGGMAPIAVFVVVSVVLAPLGEEMFFRGWIFPYLQDAGLPLAYGVSTLLFAAMHFHPGAVLAYLILGLALARLYHSTGSVWAPALAHATNNLFATMLLLSSR